MPIYLKSITLLIISLETVEERYEKIFQFAYVVLHKFISQSIDSIFGINAIFVIDTEACSRNKKELKYPIRVYPAGLSASILKHRARFNFPRDTKLANALLIIHACDLYVTYKR